MCVLDVDLSLKMNKFKYEWRMKSDYPTDKHNSTVFSCFACGGGSTMGYKLAGYNVLGCCEIDPKIIKVYRKNHNPRYSFLSDIRDLVKRDDLPDVLYNLDVLDGSPPCSTFSITGKREEGWGKEKRFREGQAKQRLDDLFFEFIKLADKLKPKVVISENVKGMLIGNAKGYVKEIVREFDKIGYDTQIFLLNGATMGLPQKRERVFFVSKRKDLNLPNLKLRFNEKPIPFKHISDDSDKRQTTTKMASQYWDEADYGGAVGKFKSIKKVNPNDVCNTLTAQENIYHHKYKRFLNKKEISLVGSFPLDYDFGDIKPQYLIGMSVPPLMMANLSYQVYEQFLSKVVKQ